MRRSILSRIALRKIGWQEMDYKLSTHEITTFLPPVTDISNSQARSYVSLEL